VLLLVNVGLCTAALDTYFGADDATRVRELVNTHRGADAATTHYVAASLALLKSTPTITCKDGLALLKGAKKIEAIYHAVSTLSTLKCDISLSSEDQKVVREALGNDNLLDMYYSSQTIVNLPERNSFNLDTVIDRVAALLDDNGGFRSSSTSEEASAVNGGFALQIVGTVVGIKSSLKQSNADSFEAISGSVDALLALGTNDEAVDFTQGSTLSGLAALSVVLLGIDSLATVSKDIDISENHFVLYADYLLKSKYVHDAEGAYHLLRGLHVIAHNPISVPLVLTLADSDVNKLSVRVTDVLGHNVPCDVVIEQANKGSTIAIRDVALKSSGDVFVLENAQKHWNVAPGLYTVRFGITPKSGDKHKHQTASQTVKVGAQLKSATLEISISDSAKGKPEDAVSRVNYPNSLVKGLNADHEKYLHARLDLSVSGDLVPSQVFLQLSKGEKSASFIPQVSGSQYTFKVNLGSTEFLESVYGSGDYSIRVIIGDAVFSTATIWKVGQITLSLNSNETQSDPFAIPPEIDHKFQPSEEHSANIFSLLFTGLVLIPLLFLLVGLLRTGFTFDIPSSPTEYLFTFLFQGALACILLLNLAYWLYLNIFQALALLSLLALVTIFVGNRALKLRYQRRTKEHVS